MPQIVRIAEADLEVGGRQIRQGEAVMPSPYLAHRNPEAFPAPDRYIPERFSDPGGDRQFSYFPFGLGSHLCVGKHLARRQLSILLAEMVRAGGFTLAPAYRLEPERYFFFMAPKGGCRMVRFEQNPSDS